MNLFLLLLGLFFLLIILYPFLNFKSYFPFYNREGLTPFDNENNNTVVPISLSDLEKKVEDLSGNVFDLNNTVDQLVVSQADYLSKNPLPQANISLSAVS